MCIRDRHRSLLPPPTLAVKPLFALLGAEHPPPLLLGQSLLSPALSGPIGADPAHLSFSLSLSPYSSA
eukprot:2700714-Rhodomonas_salina.1